MSAAVDGRTVDQLQPVETAPPNLRDDMCGPHRKRPATEDEDDITPGGQMLIYKPATGGPQAPWHQDEAYWDTSFAYRALGMWVPLASSTTPASTPLALAVPG